MSWQDLVIGVSQFLLSVSLIPIIVDRRTARPPLSASLPTAFLLGLMAVCAATIPLYTTASALMLSSVLWFVIAYQARGSSLSRWN